jgi:hypothetical protein
MGTDAWRNWRAFDTGAGERENYDDELQSDLSFTGGPVTFGPFTLSAVIRNSSAVGPTVIMRAGLHAHLIPEIVVDGKPVKADSSAYHGGQMSDELAALVSLILGVRLRVAGTLRLSGIHQEEDSLPSMYFEVPRLAQPGRAGREVIPRALERPASLDALSRLATFPGIDEVAQVELVRSARSYASGLWWANEDPNQAWLQFVTAMEIAAKRRQLLTAQPVDLLADLWPQLWEALEPSSDAVKGEVAKLLAPQMKATRTFIDFMQACVPAPPEVRPEDYDQVEWASMGKHARVIYGHRSDALHSGKPFPMPMLERPRRTGSGAMEEKPPGLNAGGLGGVWDATESPMLLSTFEYITRGALLHWWDELAVAAKK